MWFAEKVTPLVNNRHTYGGWREAFGAIDFVDGDNAGDRKRTWSRLGSFASGFLNHHGSKGD